MHTAHFEFTSVALPLVPPYNGLPPLRLHGWGAAVLFVILQPSSTDTTLHRRTSADQIPHLPTFLSTYLPTCLLSTKVPTYLPAYLPSQSRPDYGLGLSHFTAQTYQVFPCSLDSGMRRRKGGGRARNKAAFGHGRDCALPHIADQIRNQQASRGQIVALA